ncbi:MAG: hypothetical protein JRJ43_09235 [Deltaproteobacteria bacterium]|nr:hypothetical protein [Deltaproteobacteria bacterium]
MKQNNAQDKTKHAMRARAWLIAAILFALLGQMLAVHPSDAADAADTRKEYTTAEINEMINNPLGELWILFMQNDVTWYDGDALDFLGEDDKIFNTTTIMPVLSFQLTKNWKYILRPVISIHSWDVPGISRGTPTFYPGGELPASVDFDRKEALGDIVLWNAFATNEMAKPPNIYGLGFTAMVPSATDDIFGTNKWSAGPLALAVHVGPVGGFIYGVVGQHWWDFAGSSNEDHVNMSNIQYLYYYRLTEDINIGAGPNIVADWTADSDQRWTVPVGLGINTMVKIGPLPVKIGLEAYYYVESPEKFGPDRGVRFIFAPVVPKPGFSKIPIF